MFLLYNILQLICLPILVPLLILMALLISKYRGRMLYRLGLGLSSTIDKPKPDQKTIWIHALSVGEVTSAVPLIKGLREKYPSERIVLTVATRSGETIARKILADLVDHIVPSPLDFLPTVALFYARIRPHLFILVETDFWPNLLLYLQYKKTPIVLVNGRVSEKSFTGYRRFSFFFAPIFTSFTYLFMQTELDKTNMAGLGISQRKIKVLGNLKFDTLTPDHSLKSSSLSALIPENKLVLIAGSTHPGEEEIIFNLFQKLMATCPDLFLIVVPRNPARANEIIGLAEKNNLSVTTRSSKTKTLSDILLVDTIGELISFYALSHIAFVGGSLVDERGHNPIEPATFGLPVICGQYMQDFHEITLSLIESGGAIQVKNPKELEEALMTILTSGEVRQRYGEAAKNCVVQQRGVVNKHLEYLQTLL